MLAAGAAERCPVRRWHPPDRIRFAAVPRRRPGGIQGRYRHDAGVRNRGNVSSRGPVTRPSLESWQTDQTVQVGTPRAALEINPDVPFAKENLRVWSALLIWPSLDPRANRSASPVSKSD